MTLVVIGDLVADLIVLGGAALERGTDNPAEVRLTRGGSAANVAVAAAPRHPARFIGRVGDDTLARALVLELEAAGVDVRVQRDGRTGSIVVLVDAVGERTMITDRGAAAELDEIDPSWLDDAGWVHVPLYGLAEARSRRAVTDAATRAAGDGARVSLDLSSVATLRAMGAAGLRSALAALRPDVVFANEDEARVAAELGVRPAPRGVYVVKRGAEPVLVTTADATNEVPVVRVDDVLDSTGAGDAFAAGYIVAALAGSDARESARAGSVLAMGALRRPGAL
ncbi:PfkB family carbohydrate kinase [Microbacterium sp. M3]|uniref:PfkB family carbohydrate kinase n=1 Tax=Microbacterium arthrosphaerae TaxID=792652 RepID=A0ABU4H197_9MICO|nr:MULTISPECIES: PfkB family carbohydrate kinase [Microbacterium]MDW4572465.1 PfkB family carbohydrate kinase [Microbacterium arthrosphaerae]MDW7606320.1 PfkB family carbohydrate kinase [Microbacterium sp. M3]